MSISELLNKDLTEISGALVRREVSAMDLAQGYLDRIDAVQANLNAFITLDHELTRKEAAMADALRAKQTSWFQPPSGSPRPPQQGQPCDTGDRVQACQRTAQPWP
jgi:Asp-tRNA(Asn)/Glu-tRNA(Gln) amidotransferase A subunit family amidase